MNNLNLDKIIRNQQTFFIADLIAIRISESKEYKIVKCRWVDEKDKIVSEQYFVENILSQSKLPLVFSDLYIEIER